MDRIHTYRSFVESVRLGGFAAAARHLDLSRSQVSHQVAQLEDHLAVRLLHRTTRRLTLTDAGAMFYERARDLLADLEDAERQAQALHSEPKGLLKINAPLSFGVLYLAPLLPRFRRIYPDLELRVDLDDRVLDPLEHGYDLTLRIGALGDLNLAARRIRRIYIHLCASPEYLAERGQPRNPRELEQHACLHYGYLSTGSFWVLEGPGEPVSVKVRGPVCANNGEILRASALAGQGIVALPDFLVDEDLRSGRLVPVLPDWAPARAALYALYPPTRRLSAKVRAMVDFLVEALGSDGDADARISPPR